MVKKMVRLVLRFLRFSFLLSLFVGILGFVLVKNYSVLTSGPTHLLDLNNSFYALRQDGGIVGVVYKDILSGESVRYNEELKFNPASVIKVPVMVEVMHQRAEGVFRLTDKLTLHGDEKIWGSGNLFYELPGKKFTIAYLTHVMITESDNTATKMLIDMLGKERISARMKQLGLKATCVGTSNLLDAEGLNTTSPADMTLLLEKIVKHQMLDTKACEWMIEQLSEQKHRWGIPKYLPKEIKVANKTGTLSGIRNDCGIVFFERRPYVLAIFTRDVKSNVYATHLVGRISRSVFDWYNSHYKSS